MFWWNWAADQAGTQLNCPLLLPDLSSPEAPVSRGAPAGPVPKPAHHVRIPALPATHSEFGGADPTLWGNRLQNCAAGGHLHREVQRQKARGQQDPVRAVGARYDVPFCNVVLNAQIICHVINTLSLPLFLWLLFQIVSHTWSSSHTITTTWSEGILLHLVLTMSYINFIQDNGQKWSHTDIFHLFTVPFVGS